MWFVSFRRLTREVDEVRGWHWNLVFSFIGFPLLIIIPPSLHIHEPSPPELCVCRDRAPRYLIAVLKYEVSLWPGNGVRVHLTLQRDCETPGRSCSCVFDQAATVCSLVLMFVSVAYWQRAQLREVRRLLHAWGRAYSHIYTLLVVVIIGKGQ
jgi:hypothetical protein